MASVSKDGQGWRIRFINGNGVRKTIRLGRIPKATAESIGRHVKELSVAKTTGHPIPRQTALWITEIEPWLYQKLVRVDLVAEQSFPLLEAFLDDYITRGRTSQRKPAAAGTLKKWKAAKRRIVEFFGAQEPLRRITDSEVEKFRRWLEDQPVSDHTLAENTIRSIMAISKMFFHAAQRQGYITSNPFSGEASNTRENKTRSFYVKPDVATKIIETCPNTQWRLMVALWRFAGLRKTEIFHLRWSGVLWDSGKMQVSSPKTAHHAGREERFVPIGDILPWLRAAFEEPGTGDRVITQYTDTNTNLDKPLKKILTDAGVVPWPKLFQNMRASCETDWLDRGISAHVVANWIGHSVRIQVANYAQVDAHHFDRFNEQSAQAQNPAQQNAEVPRNGPKKRPKNAGKP
jgi:hypothetical protein